MLKQLMKFLIKRYIYIGAVLGAVAVCYMLWPAMPRASYLAAGCTNSTTGTIAVTLGGIFSVLAKLATAAAGLLAGAGVIVALVFCGSAARAAAVDVRARWSRKAEYKPEPKPKKIKPVLTSGAKYAHYFPHTGPGFFTRKWLDWHRAHFSSDAQVISVLTSVFAVCFVFLSVYVKPYVCTETAGQWWAFAGTMLTLDIIATALISWVWLTVFPRDEACKARDKIYGNLRHFIEGRLSAQQVLAFAVRYLRSKSVDSDTIAAIDKQAVKFAVQAVGGNEAAVRTAWLNVCRGESLIEILMSLDMRDEFIFFAELEAGKLTAGRTAKGTRTISTGVRLHIPETTSIEHLLHGVFSIFADQIKDDPEAQAALREIAARPAPAPSPAGKRKKK